MQSLNARTASLEKSIGVSGKRPVGMTDLEFFRYIAEMPPEQNKLFKAAMSIEDLKAIIEAGILLLKNEMPPALFERFRNAREAHQYELSLSIFRGYIEEKHRANN